MSDGEFNAAMNVLIIGLSGMWFPRMGFAVVTFCAVWAFGKSWGLVQ